MYLASPPSLWQAFLKGFSGNITYKRKWWLFNNYDKKKLHYFLRILFCMKSYHTSQYYSSYKWTLFMPKFFKCYLTGSWCHNNHLKEWFNKLHSLWACWPNHMGCYLVLPKWWNQGLRIGKIRDWAMSDSFLLHGRWPNNYILIKEDYRRANKAVKQDQFPTYQTAGNWVLKCIPISCLLLLGLFVEGVILILLLNKNSSVYWW